MLDESEFQRVMAIRASDVGMRQSLEHVLAEYERITGMKETNPAAVYHHRLALYGPACEFCGRPLRTPQANRCGSCMRHRS
jgi:hypothetical protein